VATRRRQPSWLSRIVLDAVHADQIREHGGLAGVRDENALESALARPRNRFEYEAAVDVPALAAVYCFGLVRSHPYRDGNKRVGFLALATFLGLNGFTLEATDEEIVTLVVALAADQVDEQALVEWVRARAKRARAG
jgi:death-on-curing protein